MEQGLNRAFEGKLTGYLSAVVEHLPAYFNLHPGRSLSIDSTAVGHAHRGVSTAFLCTQNILRILLRRYPSHHQRALIRRSILQGPKAYTESRHNTRYSALFLPLVVNQCHPHTDLTPAINSLLSCKLSCDPHVSSRWKGRILSSERAH